MRRSFASVAWQLKAAKRAFRVLDVWSAGRTEYAVATVQEGESVMSARDAEPVLHAPRRSTAYGAVTIAQKDACIVPI